MKTWSPDGNFVSVCFLFFFSSFLQTAEDKILIFIHFTHLVLYYRTYYAIGQTSVDS